MVSVEEYRVKKNLEMLTFTAIEQIEGLILLAGKSQKSDDALRFSQAACNIANSLNATMNVVK